VAEIEVLVAEEPDLPPLVEHYVPVVVVVPHGGVDGKVRGVEEIRWEDGAPTLDLYFPLRAEKLHQRDGHMRLAEAPPARQVHVAPTIARHPMLVEHPSGGGTKRDPKPLLLLFGCDEPGSWSFLFLPILAARCVVGLFGCKRG
jgi:hypothetical protein